MCNRNDYEDLFIQRGFLRDEICSMPQDVFEKLLNSFLNEDNSNAGNNKYSSSQYRYVSQKQAQENQKRYEEYIKNMKNQYQNEDDDEAMRIAMQNSLNENYAGSNNNVADEDEAMRIAIQNSLKENYANTNENPNNENENEHQQDDKSIIKDQDEEYMNATNEAYKTELEDNFSKHYEENQKIIEQENQNQREAELIGRYYGLKEEPATGVTIAIMLNGKRYIRKFNPTDLAKDIYSWIAGQTINEDDKLYLDMFQLKKATGEVIDPNLSLQDQNLKGRIMLQIDMF